MCVPWRTPKASMTCPPPREHTQPRYARNIWCVRRCAVSQRTYELCSLAVQLVLQQALVLVVGFKLLLRAVPKGQRQARGQSRS
jgi:hypothetical protein